MPELPVTGIDHPVIAVPDMVAGRAAYERLGFTVTPRGRHREWGTGNWCVMFERDYLELRGVIDRHSTHEHARQLQDKEGLIGVAFGTNDADACYTELVQRGFHPRPVKNLTRDFELTEGTVHPGFALCFLAAAEIPGLMSVVFCEHLTPELLRRSSWLRHANGALGVVELWGVVPNVADAMRCYGKLFGPNAIKSEGEVLELHPNARQSILLTTHEAARATWPEIERFERGESGRLVSVVIEVADVSATARYFTDHGITMTVSRSGSVVVPPQRASGVYLQFRSRD